MATTTNYGWTTPDDTALVKDGASAIRTLGSSVDTTTKNLNPETTLGDLSFRSSTSNVNTRIPIGSSGQHLTVVAGVPAWATASDQTPLTTKGDLLGFSTLDARIPIGANDTVLTADSAQALGLKWATPSSGGFTSIGSGSLSGSSTVASITTTGYKQLVIYVKDVTASADWFPSIRLNGDSGNNYTNVFTYMTSQTVLASDANITSAFYVDQLEATVAENLQVFTIYDPANTDVYKTSNFLIGGKHKGNTFWSIQSGYGMWLDTAAITSITFTPQGGTYSTGTYEIYGVK